MVDVGAALSSLHAESSSVLMFTHEPLNSAIDFGREGTHLSLTISTHGSLRLNASDLDSPLGRECRARWRTACFFFLRSSWDHDLHERALFRLDLLAGGLHQSRCGSRLNFSFTHGSTRSAMRFPLPVPATVAAAQRDPDLHFVMLLRG